MSEIDRNADRANALRREIAAAEAARNRIDDAIRRRQDALRRLAPPPGFRVPANPLQNECHPSPISP
jgi:hypothetical protein